VLHRSVQGVELRLRECAGRWYANVAGHPTTNKQTGGNLVATSSAVLEDAQKIIYLKLIKPLSH
jgi:hypothetical protein